MFNFFDDLTYETKVGLVIFVLVIIGCIMYNMKDRLFVKKVKFDPVVEIKDDKQDNRDYTPSNSFTGRKPGYVFTRGEQGLGYYKDKIEMQKLK
jgi:hypothetical protein